MDPENRLTFVGELRAARRQQGHIVGILTAECTRTSCPVREVRMKVKEMAASKLMQPTLKCPRCGMELYFLGLA